MNSKQEATAYHEADHAFADWKFGHRVIGLKDRKLFAEAFNLIVAVVKALYPAAGSK
jgi:hypothetical protein